MAKKKAVQSSQPVSAVQETSTQQQAPQEEVIASDATIASDGLTIPLIPIIPIDESKEQKEHAERKIEGYNAYMNIAAEAAATRAGTRPAPTSIIFGLLGYRLQPLRILRLWIP